MCISRERKKTIDGVDVLNSSTLGVIGVASWHLPVATDVPLTPKLDSDHAQRTETRLEHIHEIHEVPPSLKVQKKFKGGWHP